MKVLVDAKNFVVTAGLRQFVKRQADKLSKVAGKVTAVRVYLESVNKKTNDPQAKKVTFTIDIPGGSLVIKKKGVQMYQTIASTSRAALRSLRKRLEKIRSLKRR
ncbi:MAG: HPF/RaiA family ribosome-associated protein [Patescibacteria group bacterium]|nr:HPF/RaiA family ribosome-associated protein [Patescibacteria group bacterium]